MISGEGTIGDKGTTKEGTIGFFAMAATEEPSQSRGTRLNIEGGVVRCGITQTKSSMEGGFARPMCVGVY